MTTMEDSHFSTADNKGKRKRRRGRGAFPWRLKQVRRLVSRAAGEIMSGKTVENGGGGRRRKTGAVNNTNVELTNTFEERNEGEDYANNNDLANSSENNLNGIIVACEISSNASQASDTEDEDEWTRGPPPLVSSVLRCRPRRGGRDSRSGSKSPPPPSANPRGHHRRSSSSSSIPGVEQIRKMSDQAFRNFLDKFRLQPTSSASFHAGRNGTNGAARGRRVSIDASGSIEAAGILKKADGFSEQRRRRMSLAAVAVEEEEDDDDAMEAVAAAEREKMMKRRVSFSNHHNVRVFQASAREQKSYDIEESSLSEEEEEDKNGDTKESNLSLIPTFVFPRNRPDFCSRVRACAVTLESVRPSEDGMLCLVGSARVNAGVLKRHSSSEENSSSGPRRIVVGATYSKDGWETRQEANAMLVRSRRPEGLEDLETHCFRFVIDCSSLSPGGQLQFSVWCADKDKGASPSEEEDREVLHEDDNGKQFYTVRCCTRLNLWAELAARELSNFAPTVRFNRNYGNNS